MAHAGKSGGNVSYRRTAESKIDRNIVTPKIADSTLVGMSPGESKGLRRYEVRWY